MERESVKKILQENLDSQDLREESIETVCRLLKEQATAQTTKISIQTSAVIGKC